VRDVILQGDALEMLKTLPDESIDCCVTSPPYYGLRDYGVDGQIGLEETLQEWIDKLVAVFREVRRVLKDEATLWINLGDVIIHLIHIAVR
jgi:site-specific DNA-methyltransferase (adenine-specific)